MSLLDSSGSPLEDSHALPSTETSALPSACNTPIRSEPTETLTSAVNDAPVREMEDAASSQNKNSTAERPTASPFHFDACVAGTGLSESVVATTLCMLNYKVLQTDSANDYGGKYASLGFNEFLGWLMQEKANSDVANENTQFASSMLSGERVPPRSKWLHTTKVDDAIVISPPPVAKTSDESKLHASSWNQQIKYAVTLPEVCPQKTFINRWFAFYPLVDENLGAMNKVRKEDIDEIESKMHRISRHFHIDLLPRLLYARSEETRFLINSKAARYLSFQSLEETMEVILLSEKRGTNEMREEASAITRGTQNDWRGAKMVDTTDRLRKKKFKDEADGMDMHTGHYFTVHPIPACKGDIFSHPMLSLNEKRKLMKFITEQNKQAGSLQFASMVDFKNSAQRELLDSPNVDWCSYLRKYEISDNVINYLSYGICMFDEYLKCDGASQLNGVSDGSISIPAKKGIRRMSLFLNSLGHYAAKSALLYTMYGTCDLCQALSRCIAIQGGVQMLNASILELWFVKEETPAGSMRLSKLFLSNGISIETSKLVVSRSELCSLDTMVQLNDNEGIKLRDMLCLPKTNDEELKIVHHLVAICTRSILQSSQLKMIVILDQKTQHPPIYAMEVGKTEDVAADGYKVLHLSHLESDKPYVPVKREGLTRRVPVLPAFERLMDALEVLMIRNGEANSCVFVGCYTSVTPLWLAEMRSKQTPDASSPEKAILRDEKTEPFLKGIILAGELAETAAFPMFDGLSASEWTLQTVLEKGEAFSLSDVRRASTEEIDMEEQEASKSSDIAELEKLTERFSDAF